VVTWSLTAVFGVCFQYYLKTGTCKFGATCKYHHPREKAGSTGRVHLNVIGLPLRQVSAVLVCGAFSLTNLLSLCSCACACALCSWGEGAGLCVLRASVVVV
jgi:hypothetical protein